MFSAWCDVRGAQVLIPPGNLLATVNTADGIRVVYRCWCGAIGAMVSGAHHAGDPAGHVDAAHLHAPAC